MSDKLDTVRCGLQVPNKVNGRTAGARANARGKKLTAVVVVLR